MILLSLIVVSFWITGLDFFSTLRVALTLGQKVTSNRKKLDLIMSLKLKNAI